MTVRVDAAIPQPTLRGFLARLAQEEAGQDLVEYALIALAMGLSTVAGVHGLASTITNDLNFIVTGFNSAAV